MLSVLIWMPIVGAMLIGFWPNAQADRWARQIALILTLATVAWVVYLGVQFDFSSLGYQFEENLPWPRTVGGCGTRWVLTVWRSC